MSILEGNCLSESPPPSADVCCSGELNRSNSNSDASTLTLENCEDILHRSENLMPDDSKMWTDEKHSLYLENLEASFLKQLHQSIGLLSDQNEKSKVTTKMPRINVDNTSKQFKTAPQGCQKQEKFNSNRVERLSQVSPDSISPIKTPSVYRSKRIGVHCPATSTHMRNAENQGKVITSHGSDTCSLQLCSNSQYHGDSNYSMREGGGQNFVDEDNQSKSNTAPQAKRLKTAL